MKEMGNNKERGQTRQAQFLVISKAKKASEFTTQNKQMMQCQILHSKVTCKNVGQKKHMEFTLTHC